MTDLYTRGDTSLKQRMSSSHPPRGMFTSVARSASDSGSAVEVEALGVVEETDFVLLHVVEQRERERLHAEFGLAEFREEGPTLRPLVLLEDDAGHDLHRPRGSVAEERQALHDLPEVHGRHEHHDDARLGVVELTDDVRERECGERLDDRDRCFVTLLVGEVVDCLFGHERTLAFEERDNDRGAVFFLHELEHVQFPFAFESMLLMNASQASCEALETSSTRLLMSCMSYSRRFCGSLRTA